MSTKSNYKVPLEIGFWVVLYILWVLVFQNHTITITRTLGVEFCYLVFIALNYYITINYIIPKSLTQNKYFTFLLLIATSTAVVSFLRAVVSYYITLLLYKLPPPNFDHLYFNSLLNIFIWTSILVACKMILDRVRNKRYLEEVEKEKIKNELDFLKAQHNPHFLFNSLNSLYFQIDKANADARGTLMKLSELLRYQLYECNADKIPIDKELDYLRSYIELQHQRLDKNYIINFNVGENMKNFSIAPLLIIPLVENSFKHVSHFTDMPNVISITLDFDKHVFNCIISNTAEKGTVKPESEGGIGLNNLERRLELLYSGKFNLDITEDTKSFTAILKIEIDEN